MRLEHVIISFTDEQDVKAVYDGPEGTFSVIGKTLPHALYGLEEALSFRRERSDDLEMETEVRDGR